MLPYTAALAFLPFVTVIGLWVAWSDMKFMRIPNNAVLALLAVWVVVGVLTLPLATWGWGWAIGIIVLVVGFILSALNLIGAGDAKFTAVMAPFFVLADPISVIALFCACLLGAFVVHRVLRRIPAVTMATPDWESWRHIKFPMGLALSATIIIHLVMVILAHGSAAAAP